MNMKHSKTLISISVIDIHSSDTTHLT